MEILASFIWAGGAVMAEEIYRKQGRGRVTSFLKAILWPTELGRALASITCGGEVRVTLRDDDHG